MPLLLAALLAAIPSLAHQPHDPVATLSLSPDFDRDGIALAATQMTTQGVGARFLMLSEDGGGRWRPSHYGLPFRLIKRIAFSPDFASDRTVLVTSCKGGIHRSLDGGRSWKPLALQGGEEGPCPVDLVHSVVSSGTLYAASRRGGLLRSLDGGATWSEQAVPEGGEAEKVAVVGRGEAGERLLLATDRGLLVSDDGGESLRRVKGPLGSDAVLALAPRRRSAEGGPLYAATSRGLWRSDDQGGRWKAAARVRPTRAREGLAAADRPIPSAVEPEGPLPELEGLVTEMALLPREEGEPGVVVTTWEGVWIGEGKASSWQRSARGMRQRSPQSAIHYSSVAVAPRGAGAGRILVGGWEGIHLSPDGGESWRPLEIIPPYSTRGLAFSPGFARDRTLWAATYGSGLLRSEDGGRHWRSYSEGMRNHYLDPVLAASDYSRGGWLVHGSLLGVTRRRKGDAAWSLSPIFQGSTDACSNTPHHGSQEVRRYMRSLALSPGFATDGEMLAAGESGCIYLSEDSGETWALVHDAEAIVMSLAYLPESDGSRRVLAGLMKGGIHLSSDGGRSWSALPGFASERTVTSIDPSPGYTMDGTLFAATQHEGAYLSTDRGRSWKALETPREIPLLDLALSPDFPRDGTLFAATNGLGVLRSEDRGASWSETGTLLPHVMEVELSPAYGKDRTVAAGTLHGPYLSRDAGRSWTPTLDRARYEERSSRIAYQGDWRRHGDPGASAQAQNVARAKDCGLRFLFHGTGVVWLSTRGPEGGLAEVSVDGAAARTVDLRASVREVGREVFEIRGLPLGTHELRLRVLPSGLAGLGRGVVAVDAFDVLLRESPESSPELPRP